MDTNQFEKGSLKTLLKVSLPLMVSYLSLFTMMFVDRAFLAQYSTEALNACVKSGTLAWAVNLGWLTLAAMAEIFVAQYNGAKSYGKLGTPVWQMLWLALFSIAFLIPMGMWGSDLLYGVGSLSNTYFRWSLFFGPFYVATAALSAFYIGQGKTMIITLLAIIGNTVNIILDPIFIFGIPGKFPSMGIKGAAIATGFGVMFQAVVLFCMFLSKRNREDKGSMSWRLDPSAFFRCLKVGISPALFITFELLGWAIFYQMMSMISEQHIFVAGVCQSIFLLFVFFGCGLEKGSAAIAGNFIGAGKLDEVYRLMRSGMKLIACFALVVGFFMVIYPDFLVNWFIKSNYALKGESMMHVKAAATQLVQAKVLIRTGLFYIFFYLIFEKLRWLLSGILTAAGDTFFMMVSGSTCVWLGMVLPTYLFVVRPAASVTLSFIIWLVYSALATSIFFVRFLQGKWKNLKIIEEESAPAVD